MSYPLVVATNGPLSHEFSQLITRFKSTCPDIAFFVEAHLIRLGGVNPLELIRDSIQDKGVAIRDDRFFGPTRRR